MQDISAANRLGVLIPAFGPKATSFGMDYRGGGDRPSACPDVLRALVHRKLRVGLGSMDGSTVFFAANSLIDVGGVPPPCRPRVKGAWIVRPLMRAERIVRQSRIHSTYRYGSSPARPCLAGPTGSQSIRGGGWCPNLRASFSAQAPPFHQFSISAPGWLAFAFCPRGRCFHSTTPSIACNIAPRYAHGTVVAGGGERAMRPDRCPPPKAGGHTGMSAFLHFAARDKVDVAVRNRGGQDAPLRRR